MDPAQETVDYTAVNRLQHAYADIATRRAWDELEEIFVADIPVTIDLRDREAYVFDGRDAFKEFVERGGRPLRVLRVRDPQHSRVSAARGEPRRRRRAACT